MDQFDVEDLLALKEYIATNNGLVTHLVSDELQRSLETGSVSYKDAIQRLRAGIDEFSPVQEARNAFNLFEHEQKGLRGKRESERWLEVSQLIGVAVATQGYAIEYSLNPRVDPDQEDWFGKPHDPPLDPISTSTMRVYWCRRAVVDDLIQYQEEAETPITLHQLGARLKPNFYHNEISDLNRRQDQRLEGIEMRLPADAIVLHEEIMQLSMGGDLVQVSSQVAQMVNQIRDAILPHAVDSLAEVRGLR